MRCIGWAGVLALLMALVGCASAPSGSRPEAPEPVQVCRGWYADLDALVSRFAVNDAQDRRMDGFPQLRTSRFVASFQAQAGQSDAAFDAWFAHMRRLGDQAHALEIANLPDSAWTGWWADGGGGSRAQTLAKTRACAEVLSQHDRGQPMRRASLLALPRVADDYSTMARFFGVYALSRWPFGAGVQRWQQDTLSRFNAATRADEPPVQRYVPAPSLAREVARGAVGVPRDALGVPMLSDSLSQQLLDRHAPVIEIAPRGRFDQFGAMALGADGVPVVRSEDPVVYRRIAFTRDGEATLVQLVYLYWFSERPKTGPLDLLGGALDGVMWRVTLDASGHPLIYDSAHACGCYHLFFPTPALRPTPPPEAGIEWAFVPAQAPRLAAGERVVLGLASRTHYLRGVSTRADFSGTPYRSQDASQLRSLPLGGLNGEGGSGKARRSLYGPDGLVAGSQRGERYVFWPMGVRDAGAQRQWGRHATAFVGRRHFDDADLIERRFERVGAAPAEARTPAEH